jgi:DNA repair exonuclease SbcCD ATPase subunit
MIEPPQFRTVLRGADPEQVAEAIKELHTSLVVARRAAADRTIELSRMQEEHQSLQAALQAAEQRITELEQSGGTTARGATGGLGYGDLGSRIGSMLSLAEEEAAQMRAAAETEIAERREHAVSALNAELTAEQGRLEETQARTAALEEELGRLRGRAEAEREQLRAEAVQEADEIRRQARADAERQGREAEAASAVAVAQRDEVHARLGEVAAYIADLLGAEPSGGQPVDEPHRTLELEEPDVPPESSGGGPENGYSGSAEPADPAATQVMSLPLAKNAEQQTDPRAQHDVAHPVG